MHLEAKPGRNFIGRFKFGKDLLEELTGFCKEKNIRLGTFSIIGAVTSAKIGYYNQERKQYSYCVDINKKLEINACIGNISLKDGEIFAHAHITLADFEGKTYGGHLMPGTPIYAAEFHIQELLGGELKRVKDKDTGLPLWEG